ncbi:branched-chain amino acid ABC transporter ATP-binding protein/permease [Rhodopseudomonas pseudopalustris]|nr:branched-chain amino acid ABC transporter ATP-binding protein/permease [Rhodopseudomonas pseudopalustris]
MRFSLLYKVLLASLLCALLIVPVSMDDQFVYHIFITICIFAALSSAWNIVGGFAGQLSLGHTIFYGIGSYAGIILMNLGVSPWIGLFVGAAVSVVVAIAISYPCFRLKGPFFALATIAFLEVFRALALHWKEFTGGATGAMIPLKIGLEWMVFQERLPQLLIAFGLVLLTLIVSWWIHSHRIGFYLIATRERESAANAAGVNTVKVRLIAVAVSAALTSLVGTFHAIYLSFIEPAAAFSLTTSIQIVMFALVGGLGTVVGPLLGAVILVPISELARGWLGAHAAGLHGFVYGLVLMLVALFMPSGLMGLLPRGKPQTSDDPQVDRPGVSATSAPAAVPVESKAEIMRVEHLEKSFGGLRVTNNVSFNLREGEILGLIGPNGAGKTTLFNQLSGFLAPDSGSVSVRDRDGVWRNPSTPADFAAIGIGRTFQIAQPFAAMTVEENIMVGAFHRFADVREAREVARETADRMQLGPWLHAEARGLTVGGLKRLEVARVLAMKPRILLLDEVMAGINQTDVRRAIDLILKVRDGGVSIIAIEHVMQAVMSLSDRVIVLNSGVIIAEGAPREVVKDPTVVEAYLGKEFADAQA